MKLDEKKYNIVMPMLTNAIRYEKMNGFVPSIDNIRDKIAEILKALGILYDEDDFDKIVRDIEYKEQLYYLKKVGEILQQLSYIRRNTSLTDFYLNDLHASNFILNKQTSRINVVDMDSSRIGNSLSSPSRYLNEKSFISEVPKYKKVNNNIGGIYEADENTDLYCYTMMILDYL